MEDGRDRRLWMGVYVGEQEAGRGDRSLGQIDRPLKERRKWQKAKEMLMETEGRFVRGRKRAAGSVRHGSHRVRTTLGSCRTMFGFFSPALIAFSWMLIVSWQAVPGVTRQYHLSGTCIIQRWQTGTSHARQQRPCTSCPEYRHHTPSSSAISEGGEEHTGQLLHGHGRTDAAWSELHRSNVPPRTTSSA
ncbi:hypothetical protein LZ30DRAFT_716119 [Colletotrichum cereale]|nr:hypothetical protein LZ30DRAFT_716119 [Colletotrichum cereale]